MLYESIPQRVQAVQWRGDNLAQIESFINSAPADRDVVRADSGELFLMAGLHGAQGWVSVPVGHWIVRMPLSPDDYWPVDADYFSSKYRKVDDEIHPIRG